MDADGNIIYKQLLGGLNDKPDENGKYHVEKDIPITADNLSISDESHHVGVLVADQIHLVVLAAAYHLLAVQGDVNGAVGVGGVGDIGVLGQLIQKEVALTKLNSAREQQIYDLEVSVDEVNKKIRQIAGLNQTIMDDAASISCPGRWPPG